MARKSEPISVPAAVKRKISKITEDGGFVKVVGRMKDGRLELDSAGVAALEKQYPDANLAFVAVNAPFAPRSRLQ